jgi:hypothetical protein
LYENKAGGNFAAAKNLFFGLKTIGKKVSSVIMYFKGVGVSNRRFFGGLNLFNGRVWRSLVKPLHHFFHPAFFSFNQGLNRAVGPVPHPAGKFEFDSFVPGVSPEKNTLHPAFDYDVHSFCISHESFSSVINYGLLYRIKNRGGYQFFLNYLPCRSDNSRAF